MPVLPIEIPQFGGLDLTDDPQQIAQGSAIDLLNVDFDRLGRVRSRDGYSNFTTAPAATRYRRVWPFMTAAGVPQLLARRQAGASIFLDALNTSGGVIASADVSANAAYSAAALGTPTGASIYFSGNGTLVKWDGAAFTTVALTPLAYHLTTSPVDNRLVAGNTSGGPSRVQFSDPGLPETWGANNFVDLMPGDGEAISSMCTWRELVFVFKETKFFVFTGTSTSSTGTPVFNYRTVTAGVGVPVLPSSANSHSVAVAPDGVYFYDRKGIYLTTGGPPTLISRAIDGIFSGDLPATFQSSALNGAAVDAVALAWHRHRLYVAYPSGSSTTNDRVLVYDPVTNVWSLWDIPINGMTSWRAGTDPRLFFAYGAGANQVGQVAASFTTDAGTAIASRYRTGFLTPAVFSSTRTRRGYPWPGAEGVVREWLIDGQGTVNIKTAFNDSPTLGAAAAVTLATAPATAQGRDRRAVRGRNVSVEISATSAPWQVSRLIANIMDSRGPGLEAAP